MAEIRRDARLPRCPLCGRELRKPAPGGWLCDCGEFIPSGLAAAEEGKCSCDPLGH